MILPEDRKVNCIERWPSEDEIPTGLIVAGSPEVNTADTELANRRSVATKRRRIGYSMRLGTGLSYL